MSIKSDRWIRERSTGKAPMIEPFEAGQVRTDADGGRIVSFGTSSYGYDVRCADEFKIFTNVHSTVVDPKAFDPSSFVDVKADTCIIPPNSFALARTVEYFRIPRNVLTVCLGKSTYARCFSADTRVALVDGRAPTFEQMARGAESGERFFGYGIGPHGTMLVTELVAPRLVGRDPLVEVELDDGGSVRATPDHEFMLRDGTMRPAAELAPGTSLMPLYRTLRRGYEMTFQPLTGQMLGTHRMADAWNLRHGLYGDVPGTHRHHLDHERLNNNPWNIMRMEASAHLRLHNDVNYGEGFDSLAHGAAISASLSRLRADDMWYARYRQAQSSRAASFWQDSKYVEARRDLCERQVQRWTPDERLRQAERQRDFWRSNPAARARQGDRSRQAWLRSAPERRIDQAAHARGLNLRSDITAKSLRAALDATGSLRDAARYLDVDRSAFRRFPEVVAAFRGEWRRPTTRSRTFAASRAGTTSTA